MATSNTTLHHPSEYLAAALAVQRASQIFRQNTGFHPEKARELISAAVVNQWLSTHHHDWQIQAYRDPDGPDGCALGRQGEHLGAVEFKATYGSTRFIFRPDFPFNDHYAVVLSVYNREEGVPSRIVLAFGREYVAALAANLDADRHRSSYRPHERPELQLYLDTQRARGSRMQDAPGVLSLAGKLPDAPGGIVDIRADTIAAALTRAHCNVTTGS